METTIIIRKKEVIKPVKFYVPASCNKAGLTTSVYLMGIFLLMMLFHLQQIIPLNFIVVFFLIAFTLISIYQYKQKKLTTTTSKVDTISGLKIATHILLTAVIPFVVFISLYFSLSGSFLNFTEEYNSNTDNFFSANFASGIIMIEGGTIATLRLFDFLKKKTLFK